MTKKFALNLIDESTERSLVRIVHQVSTYIQYGEFDEGRQGEFVAEVDSLAGNMDQSDLEHTIIYCDMVNPFFGAQRDCYRKIARRLEEHYKNMGEEQNVRNG